MKSLKKRRSLLLVPSSRKRDGLNITRVQTRGRIASQQFLLIVEVFHTYIGVYTVIPLFRGTYNTSRTNSSGESANHIEISTLRVPFGVLWSVDPLKGVHSECPLAAYPQNRSIQNALLKKKYSSKSASKL